MRRGHRIAPILLALALGLPPLLTLVAEVNRAGRAGQAPEMKSYGFGEPPEPFVPPPGARRGRHVPARIVDFRSPSIFRSTFFVHLPPGECPAVGAVVMTPERALAGAVVKVWKTAGIALARSPEDPAFRVACRCGSREAFLTGRGDALGLTLLAGNLGDASDELVWTAGTDGVFPAGLLVGYRRAETSDVVVSAFDRSRATWVYLWRDPDLEALEAAVGPRAGL
jgi:hypothetical protein